MKNRTNSTGFFEALEKRDFLAADLTGTFPSLGVVTMAPGGTATVDFTVSNFGNAKSKAATASFVARPEGAVDASADIVLGTGKLPALGIEATSPALHIKLAAPINALPGTNYHIVGIINDANQPNDTVVGGPLTISTPTFNLTSSIADVKLPSSVLSGTSVKGIVKINVSLAGAGTLPKNAKVNIELWLAKEGGDNVRVGTMNAQALAGLNSGKPKTFTTKVALNSIAAGTYRFFAVVDPSSEAAPTGALTESNDTLVDNTSALSSFSLTAAPAFANLAIDAASTTTLGATGSTAASASANIIIKNTGNTAVNGKGSIVIYATTDGTIQQGSPVVASLTNQNFKLAPGAANKPIKANLDLSVLESGTYKFVARLESLTGVTDSNAEDNTFQLAPASVVLTAPVTAASMFGTVTFHQTDIQDVTTTVPFVGRAGFVGSTGTFTSSNGRSGSYSFSAWYGPEQNKNGTLRLIYSGSPTLDAQALMLTYNSAGSRTDSLDGKSMQFSTSGGGTTGKVKANGAILTPSGLIDFNGFFRQL